MADSNCKHKHVGSNGVCVCVFVLTPPPFLHICLIFLQISKLNQLLAFLYSTSYMDLGMEQVFNISDILGKEHVSIWTQLYLLTGNVYFYTCPYPVLKDCSIHT